MRVKETLSFMDSSVIDIVIGIVIVFSWNGYLIYKWNKNEH